MRGKLDILTLIVSAVAGCAWWLLGGFLYRSLLPRFPSPIVIALYFFGLALMLIAACVLAASLHGYSHAEGRAFGKAFLLLLAILVAGGVFQFLYTLEGVGKTGNSTSYVFMLDDSGSMQDNDPNQAVCEAVKKVMAKEKEDFPFAAYAFSDDCRLIVPVTRAADVNSVSFHMEQSGGTHIATSIDMILDDLERGVLNGGKRPRIILLSDGVDMDYHIEDVLTRAKENNVSISTVGFGDADELTLRLIAEFTGGVYVPVENIDDLDTAMQTAAVERSAVNRTLVTLRLPVKLDWLYGLLRCLFLVLLGAGFLLIKAWLMRTNDRESDSVLENALAILIAALSVELLTNLLGLNDQIGQLVLCLGFCLLMTSRAAEENRSASGRSHSFEDEEETEWTTGSVG